MGLHKSVNIRRQRSLEAILEVSCLREIGSGYEYKLQIDSNCTSAPARGGLDRQWIGKSLSVDIGLDGAPGYPVFVEEVT